MPKRYVAQMQETEFSFSELIHYYWQRLNLIKDSHIRTNPNIEKDSEFQNFQEVLFDPLKWYAFDIAVELHRNNSKPWGDF